MTRIFLLLAQVALTIGCVAEPYLHWDGRPPAFQVQGRVAVKFVVNRRPPKLGENDPTNLGNERSGFGIPYAVRLQGELNPPLDQTISRMVSEAMTSAGVGVTQMNDPSASSHLSIEIHNLWCDGYSVYTAKILLQLVLLDPRTGAVRMRIPVEKQGSAGFCREAYHRALTDAFYAVSTAFTDPSVRAAAIAGP